MMEPHSFTYLMVVGALIAFADGFGIGANDVANSFSTSVGSRSITFKQAASIAIFSEFLGALLLGSNTSETIRGSIIKVDLFKEKPELLMVWLFYIFDDKIKCFPKLFFPFIINEIVGYGLLFNWLIRMGYFRFKQGVSGFYYTFNCGCHYRGWCSSFRF
jgi:hypothetical protein